MLSSFGTVCVVSRPNYLLHAIIPQISMISLYLSIVQEQRHISCVCVGYGHSTFCCVFVYGYGHVGLVPNSKIPLENICLWRYINTAKLLPMAQYLFSLESFLWYVFTLTSCPPQAQRTFYYLPFYQLLCSSLLSIRRQHVLLHIHFSRQSLWSVQQSLSWWHILRVFSPGSFPVGSTIPFRHRAEGLCRLLLWLNQLSRLLACMPVADLVLLCPAPL